MLAIYDFERGSWKPDGPHNPNKKINRKKGIKIPRNLSTKSVVKSCLIKRIIRACPSFIFSIINLEKINDLKCGCAEYYYFIITPIT